MTLASIAKIAALFALPMEGIEQDWECFVADPARIEEFMRAYDEPSLTSDDRSVLMSLVLMSADDWMKLGGPQPPVWDKIVEALARDRALHRHLLDYWACWINDDDPEREHFALTPLIRAQITVKERILTATLRMIEDHEETLRKLAL